MSNQVYIPPINFNEFDNQTGSITSINAVEPLEYNKLNSNLSIKAATENNYGVITTGDQNIKGNKNFVDGLTLSTGTISTTPTKDTDITNKKYVDTKTTDLVKYNTSTKYLIDNKTNSNISNFRINNLSIDNQINGSSVSVSVSTSGYHGTDTKNITVYKGYVNGMTCIIFNKNTEINEYHWVSEIAMNENGIVMDFSNFSDIYSSLPQMFELKGEVSTYGGNRHIATKTLKFVKSSGYKYTVQYDKSYPMNLFKLKDSIKNTDTYIFTSETNKIGTLTIDKGYLYNTPTENNNLVNKSYVDSKDTEIKNSLNSNVSTLNENIENAKTELNGNIDNAKTELNENITSAINGIREVNLSTGTLDTVKNNNNSLTNKSYVDGQIGKAKLEINKTIKDTETEINTSINNSVNNAKSELNTSIDNAKAELNAKINSSINGIKNVDLTTGTISTTPTNDTDIANKKFVTDQVNSGNGNVIRYNKESFEVLDSDNVAFNLLKFNCFVQIDNDLKTSSISSSTIISNEIQAKTNLNSENLTTNTSTISTLNSGNINNTGKVDTFQLSANATELANLTVNDTINFSNKILSVLTCNANIENYQGEVLTTCKVSVLRIKLNANTYYIKLSFNFAPFTTVEQTFPTYYIRYIDIPLSGTSQSFDINYFYKQKQIGDDGHIGYNSNLSVGRCLMSFYNGQVAFNVNKYVVQLGNTEASRSIPNNCEIFTIPDITFIYSDSA